MKQISIILVGFAAAFAAAPALAEDFTAGKTPAQLFRSDCGACHRSPNGLVKERDVAGLTAFLREHYTTKPETAAALAAYVSGLASAGTSARNRGTATSGRERARSRSEGDTPETATAVPAGARPADEPPGHRRRAGPSEGERRRARDDGDVPRPPRGVGIATSRSATASKPDAAKPDAVKPETPAAPSQPQEAADPISRLRSYLSSGLDSEGATAQAAPRTGTPKARKRRSNTNDAKASADAPAPAEQAPAQAEEPAVQAAPAAEPAPSEAAPAEPQ